MVYWSKSPTKVTRSPDLNQPWDCGYSTHQQQVLSWDTKLPIINPNLVGGANPSEKYVSQLGSLFPIYGAIKHVPDRQWLVRKFQDHLIVVRTNIYLWLFRSIFHQRGKQYRDFGNKSNEKTGIRSSPTTCSSSYPSNFLPSGNQIWQWLKYVEIPKYPRTWRFIAGNIIYKWQCSSPPQL